VKQIKAALRIFYPFVMEAPTVLLIEWNITGDIVVSANEYLDSKLRLLEPLDGLLKL